VLLGLLALSFSLVESVVTSLPRTMYDSCVGLRYQGSRQAAVVSRMPKAAGGYGLWWILPLQPGVLRVVSVYGVAGASSSLWVGCWWFRVVCDCGVVRGAARPAPHSVHMVSDDTFI
jgi:hypothetical protein